MSLRFSFDLGTSSVGWAVYQLAAGKPTKLLGCGARIFPDGREPSSKGRTGESLAKGRRDARSPRRRRDRFIQRRHYLLTLLKKHGLLPAGEKEENTLSPLDPYELRHRALSEALDLHHFGRALFHLNQRRGFKSNRKTDAEDKDKGKIALGADVLQEKLDAGRFETLGAYYWHEHSQGRQVRVRISGEGAEASYDFYPLRALLEKEFDILWARQAEYHTKFPDTSARDEIRHAIFWQRPLKAVEAGRCSYFPDEHRLAKSHPMTQERIIYELVNKIRLEEAPGRSRSLTRAERDKTVNHLMTGSDLTWKAFRKKLNIETATRLNLEEGGDKNLPGNLLIKILVGLKKPGPFKDHWYDYTPEQQLKIIEKLEDTEDTDELVKWLRGNAGLDEDTARAAAAIRLPQGYSAIGDTATRRLVEELRKDVVVYSEAAANAGLHHSDKRDGEVFDLLPKYNTISQLQRHLGFGTGKKSDPDDIRYGRVANPSVHVGLNQLRRVVNAMCKKYGRPDEVVLELTRELKQSAKQKEEAAKRNRINRAANERRRSEMLATGKVKEGDRKIREQLVRMRLWEELGPVGDRRCPYSGDQISLNALLSDAIEIEHILPRSRTLDDSMANKTVAFRDMNRLKRNLSPAEAADRYPDKINKEDMLARTAKMPPNKRWRFHDWAIDQYKDEEGFMDRQLNETRHFSRLAAAYMSKLNPANPSQKEMHVWVTTGRLTAELRRKWGLHLPGHNQKTRDDLRHHALDACVIGVIDRSMIQRLASAAARDEESGINRILSDIPDPYDGFSEAVNEQVAKVIISHRPNHRAAGQLHEDTNYGLLNENTENLNRGEPEIGNVVRRKRVEDLSPKEIGQIRDLDIRAALEQMLAEVREDFPTAKDFKKQLPIALAQWTEDKSLPPSMRGTKRVRVLKPMEDILGVKDKNTGNYYKYKYPKIKHHIDIIELKNGNWHGVAVSVHNVNQKDMPPFSWSRVYPDAKFIMRLHKSDTLQLFGDDGVNEFKQIKAIEISANRLKLSGIKEGGQLDKRHKDKDVEFKYDFANIPKLKERHARRVRIDEIGVVHTIPHGQV